MYKKIIRTYSDGRVEEIVGFEETTTVDALDREIYYKTSNGDERWYSYDDADNVTYVKHKHVSGDIICIYEYFYTYDSNKNRIYEKHIIDGKITVLTTVYDDKSNRIKADENGVTYFTAEYYDEEHEHIKKETYYDAQTGMTDETHYLQFINEDNCRISHYVSYKEGYHRIIMVSDDGIRSASDIEIFTAPYEEKTIEKTYKYTNNYLNETIIKEINMNGEVTSVYDGLNRLTAKKTNEFEEEYIY